MTPTGMRGNRRVNARSSGSNQLPESPFLEYEEDDKSLVYSLRSEGVLDTHTMVLLNLRRSMAEQVRQKLKEKLIKSFAGFMDILHVSQDDNGKVCSLECEVKGDTEAATRRLIIGCEGDDTFLVYQDRPMPQDALNAGNSVEFERWLEALSAFGLSGRCSSLSSLFQFAYDQWLRLIRNAPSLSEEQGSSLSTSSGLSRAMNDLEAARPHAAIDTLSQLMRSDCEDLHSVLSLRCRAYAQAGMFSLCLVDIEQLQRLTRAASADVHFWKGVSLQALQRQEEAVQAYLDALEADSGFIAAQERLDDLLSGCTSSLAAVDASPVTPRSSRVESHHSRRHARRDRIDSVPESGTTGTTASRWSSRSTTPTSCASGDLQQL